MVKLLKFACVLSSLMLINETYSVENKENPAGVHEQIVNDTEDSGAKTHSKAEDDKSVTEDPIHEEVTVEAPAYKKLVPVIGWNRQMGDAARSISQWGRWIQYLRLKKPVVMKWMDNLVLRIYPGNEVFRALYVRGIYDPNLNVVIDALLPKNGVLIDAGANMGYFTLLASRKVGDDGRIYAVEPSTRDFIRLVDNININNLNEIVSTYRLAFYNQKGKAKMLVAGEERSGLNTIGSEFSTKGVEQLGTEEVDITTIDAFFESEKIHDVNVLKLDVEGSETQVLDGARGTIQKYRPALMIGIKKSALAACGSSFEELSQKLKDLKYIAYKIVQDPDDFRLEKVDDLSKSGVNVVFCLHESIMPPKLPQPEKKSIMDTIADFFTM